MLTLQDTAAIRRIESAIGYTFRDKRLLVQVFTRKTYMKIDPEAPDNEVLEFYGDMLMSYHVTTYFVEKFAHMLDDGLYFMRTVEQFTEMRSHYVRNQYLTERIKQLIPNIDRLVRAQNPRLELPKDNQKAYADLFESLIGAVYLDSYQDEKLIRAFILHHLNIEPKVTETSAAGARRSSDTVVLPSVSLVRDEEDTPADLGESVSADAVDADAPVDREPVPVAPIPSPADAPMAEEPPAVEADEALLRSNPPARRERSPKPARPETEAPSVASTDEPRMGGDTASHAEVPAVAESAPAATITASAASSEPLSATEPDAPTTGQDALAAFCREVGYEAPVYGETPKNAPNARPVAACTVRFRNGRGKPVKISLNDSGRTLAEATEKAAFKMLKKLREQREADGMPTTSPNTAVIHEALPAEIPSEAPIESPVEAPVAAPVEIPVETPVETPVEMPVEAPVAAPVEEPVEAPAAAPAEAPAETLAETPAASSAEASAVPPAEEPDPTDAPTDTPTEAVPDATAAAPVQKKPARRRKAAVAEVPPAPAAAAEETAPLATSAPTGATDASGATDATDASGASEKKATPKRAPRKSAAPKTKKSAPNEPSADSASAPDMAEATDSAVAPATAEATEETSAKAPAKPRRRTSGKKSEKTASEGEGTAES